MSTHGRRIERLNSLLKEVISQVIFEEVRNPEVSQLCAVTLVNVSRDLRHAKVYVSIIGNEEEKNQTVFALQSAAGFIATQASKQVKIRYFPELVFKLDRSVERQMQIDSILEKISRERNTQNDTNHP